MMVDDMIDEPNEDVKQLMEDPLIIQMSLDCDCIPCKDLYSYSFWKEIAKEYGERSGKEISYNFLSSLINMEDSMVERDRKHKMVDYTTIGEAIKRLIERRIRMGDDPRIEVYKEIFSKLVRVVMSDLHPIERKKIFDEIGKKHIEGVYYIIDKVEELESGFWGYRDIAKEKRQMDILLDD